MERFGNYVVMGEIGRGGMGVVYRAKHPELGREAAVKVLAGPLSRDPDLIARFFDEARAATAVKHPGIVQIFDLGKTDDGAPYYVMELLEGESLGERLQRGALSVVEAVAVAEAVAEAVGAVHAAGIVHRDLKPANVFLTPDGLAKVLDFGVAKLLTAAVDKASAPTLDGALLGTPHYMSPEQASGRGHAVTERSDIYSLGAMLFEMLCGDPPFDGDSALGIALMHVQDEPPRPSEVRPEARIPPALDEVVLRALAKVPEERFDSMAELVQAMRAAVPGKRLSGIRRLTTAPPRPRDEALDRTIPASTAERLSASPPSTRAESGPRPAVRDSRPMRGRLDGTRPPESGIRADGPRSSSSLDVAPHVLTTATDLDERPTTIPKTSAVDSGRVTELTAPPSPLRRWGLPAGLGIVAVGAVAWAIIAGSGGRLGPGTATATPIPTGGSEVVSADPATAGPAGPPTLIPPRAPRSATVSDEAYAAYLRGMDAFNKFRFAAGVSELERALELDPGFASAHLALATYPHEGSSATIAGHLERAESAVHKLSPDERAVLEVVHALNREPQDVQRALELLEARVARYPGDVWAWWKLGEVRAVARDDDGSAEAFERLVTIAPGYLPAYNSMAYVLARLERYDDALAALQKYLEAIPNEPNPYDSRGDVLLLAGRFDEARAAFRTALALDPGFIHSAVKLAILDLREGKHEEADKRLADLTASSGLAREYGLSSSVWHALLESNVPAAVKLARSIAKDLDDRGERLLLVQYTFQWALLVGRDDVAKVMLELAAGIPGSTREWMTLVRRARFDPEAWNDNAVEDHIGLLSEREGERRAEEVRHKLLAWRALGEGHPEEIAGLLGELRGMAGMNTSSLILRGIGRLAVGDNAGADRDLRKADVVSIMWRAPHLGVAARYHRGIALERLGRKEEARIELEAVIRAWGKVKPPLEMAVDAARRMAELGEP